MIRVLLVDDHTMVRKGIRMLLQAYPDVEIIGESHDGNDAILKAAQLLPDVVLMDLSMPGGLDGFRASREIHKQLPKSRIVILTMFDEEIYIQQAVQVGAYGYILKNSHGELLIEAIRNVQQGKRFYKTSIADEKIRQWMGQQEQASIANQRSRVLGSILTDRETEIVRLIALGYANKEVADKLMISVKTVENHKTNIMQKLEITTKRELIQFALRNHFLDLAL
ncbi:DNA-binding response regulator [Brevibacillus fluminis]|uniref:DNA-binding response regulator n=1 Tax=Brevibacillus fluminis TaxID=511487 RepID=A0A3M8DVA3_9BACL|nr:response regulator transcription factor [Brevibacillus fluminis]RNB91439.1 DNA-binding response regulator [Brevibacillus fluminis]